MKTFEPKSVEQLWNATDNAALEYSKQHVFVTAYDDGAKETIKNYYAPLLTAYTTLQTELAQANENLYMAVTLKDKYSSELEQANLSLHLEQTSHGYTKQELAQVRKERDSANELLKIIQQSAEGTSANVLSDTIKYCTGDKKQ